VRIHLADPLHIIQIKRMASIEDLYQEIILDHHRRPRNYGPLAGATHRAKGHNPLCGDDLSVHLRVIDGKIEAIHFQGQGCAISRASASLMSEALSGKKVEDARSFSTTLLGGLKSGQGDLRFEEVGDLAALSGIRLFPARIKCATLAWHAFLSALEGAPLASTE
jgi:nitrogen fixation protein NifU and related proteins